jgi:GH25 family lysozyme M1 (1,4-beta-N-acetylmuramidase)
MDLCFVADLGSQNPVDFGKLKNASYNAIKCEGVILRATRSNCLPDTLFASRATAAEKLGFLVGAYAFNTGETAAAQAARFLTVTKAFDPILRALDFETNTSGRQMSLAACVEFLDRVSQATGRQTWLYSGDRIKSLIVTATEAQRQALSEALFWGCEYGPAFKDLDDDGHPLPWDAPTLWQDSGDGIGPQPHTLAGLEAGADLSIFKGTRAQLAAIWPGASV